MKGKEKKEEAGGMEMSHGRGEELKQKKERKDVRERERKKKEGEKREGNR